MSIRMRGDRGMVLLTALLLMVVVALIGRALVVMGPSSLALANSAVQKAEARRAAESGIEYATSRLREDPEWKGDAGVTIDTPEMYVLEDKGNVIGLVKTPDGRKSQFRFRFNYQDGDAGNDGLDQPTQLIDNIYVSVNNLGELGEAVVPRANSGTWDVSSPDTGYTVPGRAACIIVEGKAGRGLQALDNTSPNAPVAGHTDSYVAEVFLEVASTKPLGDASMMGAGDILVNLGGGSDHRVEVLTADKKSVPRMRSKKGVTVNSEVNGPGAGRLEMEEGRVSRNDSLGLQAVYDSSEVTETHENVGDSLDFFNMRWSEVEKADSTTPLSKDTVQLKGGVYVTWGKDGSLSPAVHYYDMEFDDFKAYMETPAGRADPGTVLDYDLSQARKDDLSSPKNFSIVPWVDPHGNRFTDWRIKSDMAIVESDNAISNFAVLPRMGGALSSTDTSLDIQVPAGLPASATNHDNGRVRFRPEDCVVSFPGDALIVSKLNATNATLTAEGDMTINSPNSSVQTDGSDGGGDGSGGDSGSTGGDSGSTGGDGGDGGDGEESGNGNGYGDQLRVNLYVKGNIEVSSYRRSNQKYSALNWRGLIYSWSNFEARIGEPGYNYGNLRVRGALVAYGSDPETGTPGLDSGGNSTGTGNINIDARNVILNWDEDKLSDMLDIGTVAIDLKRTLYNTY